MTRVLKLSPAYSEEIKIKIGRNLMMAPRGSRKAAAQALNVTTRTLRSWRKQAEMKQCPRKRGRKNVQATLADLLAIAREWRRQGCPGSRPVINALSCARVRLVREVIAGLKERKRRRASLHRIANRTHVRVNEPGIFVVFDAAKVPRKEGGECIVFRDRGSLRTEAKESAENATCASDTLVVLNELKTKNRLPLVAGTDNGSTFVAKVVGDFMDDNKVVHLRSLPRVPQHNGSAENAVGEVKRLIRDGATLEIACRTLNDCRNRQTLNWKTSTQVDQKNFQPCTEEKRSVFYNAAKRAINLALFGMKSASIYERRKAEREAIFQTLENFSLITRTPGHRRA